MAVTHTVAARRRVDQIVVNITNRIEFGDFQTTLQDAINAELPDTSEELRADLYARIVTGQEHLKFNTWHGLSILINREVQMTKGIA